MEVAMRATEGSSCKGPLRTSDGSPPSSGTGLLAGYWHLGESRLVTGRSFLHEAALGCEGSPKC